MAVIATELCLCNIKQYIGRAGWNVTFFHKGNLDYMPCCCSSYLVFVAHHSGCKQVTTRHSLSSVSNSQSPLLWPWKGLQGIAHDSILPSQAASFLLYLRGKLNCRRITSKPSLFHGSFLFGLISVSENFQTKSTLEPQRDLTLLETYIYIGFSLKNVKNGKNWLEWSHGCPWKGVWVLQPS